MIGKKRESEGFVELYTRSTSVAFQIIESEKALAEKLSQQLPGRTFERHFMSATR